MPGFKGVTRQQVLDILTREADFDGNTIITEREIADELGLKTRSISSQIRNLEDAGIIKVTRNLGSLNTISFLED
jgi:DNA-binding Lrp family transcriptional regulator